jgi:hypothetical protein
MPVCIVLGGMLGYGLVLGGLVQPALILDKADPRQGVIIK